MAAPHIYLVAGEASADALGAGLMRSLKALSPDMTFSGIGGEAMQAEGLASLFPYRELSLMGFWEVVPHIPAMLRRLKETRADIASKKPDAVITIDSPGFCFRLAECLKNDPHTASIPRIHYVAPSVWAYKPKRAATTARLFQLLLALLPFEPPHFEKEGLKTVFVGHPVLWQSNEGNAGAFRKRHGIASGERLLLLLPGSRRGEVSRHLPDFLSAADRLSGYRPVILAGAQVRDMIVKMAPPTTLVISGDEKYDAFAAADLALSKSGTVTLELAKAGVPMVVAHRVHPVSAWLLRRMALIRYVSLVNIAANKEIVPELLQERFTLPALEKALAMVSQPETQAIQRAECARAIAALKGDSADNPSDVAARTVINNIYSKRDEVMWVTEIVP